MFKLLLIAIVALACIAAEPSATSSIIHVVGAHSDIAIATMGAAAVASPHQQPIIVYPFRTWCEMRGISIATGRRLVESGRVKVTQLSERRIGIRSDHDLEYLDSCSRDGA